VLPDGHAADIEAGEILSLNDVEYDPNCQTMQLREQMKKFLA
jgi:predicted homoserine dehydrogenase-like protein